MKYQSTMQKRTEAAKPDEKLDDILKNSDKKVRDIFERRDPDRHAACRPTETERKPG